MTERTGGSDVSTTSTIAKPEGQNYRLYGKNGLPQPLLRRWQ